MLYQFLITMNNRLHKRFQSKFVMSPLSPYNATRKCTKMYRHGFKYSVPVTDHGDTSRDIRKNWRYEGEGWQEAMNRKTDNTMTKEKDRKTNNNGLQNHRLNNSPPTPPPPSLKEGDELWCPRNVHSPCYSTGAIRRVTVEAEIIKM